MILDTVCILKDRKTVMSYSIPGLTIPLGHPQVLAHKKFLTPGPFTVNFFSFDNTKCFAYKAIGTVPTVSAWPPGHLLKNFPHPPGIWVWNFC